MQALDLASLRGEFYYHVTTTSFGPYVDQIGRYCGAARTAGCSRSTAPRRPSARTRFSSTTATASSGTGATFGPTGGPPTLR